MSNVYEINYSSMMHSYIDQVPIFVLQRGVTQEQFKSTIQKCSEIARENMSKLKIVTICVSIFYIFLEFATMIAMIAILMLFLTTLRLSMFFLFGTVAVFAFILAIVSITIPIVLKTLRTKIYATIKNETNNLLEKKNQELFMPKGIQLMFQMKAAFMFLGNRTRPGIHPQLCIQCLMVADPNMSYSTTVVYSNAGPAPMPQVQGGYYQAQPQMMNPFMVPQQQQPQYNPQPQQQQYNPQQPPQYDPQQPPMNSAVASAPMAPQVPVYGGQANNITNNAPMENPYAPLVEKSQVQKEYDYFE